MLNQTSVRHAEFPKFHKSCPRVMTTDCYEVRIWQPLQGRPGHTLEKCEEKEYSLSSTWNISSVVPIGGELGGRRPPQDSQKFFLLVSLIQCSVYVHAYQASVHISTWITLIGGADTGLLAWRCKKKFPLLIKIFAPPRNLWIGATDIHTSNIHIIINSSPVLCSFFHVSIGWMATSQQQ